MGNHASSGERRPHKPGDPFIPHTRMEGQAFNIDKHRAQKQLMSQSSEDDQLPVFCKAPQVQVEGKENIEPVVSISRPILTQSDKKLLPCVIKYNGLGKDVAIAGSFNNWQALPMVKSEKDFVAIVDLTEGDHQYKFLVDGEWKLNATEKACANELGTENNVLSVKETDFEELENALLRDPNDKKESPYTVSTHASRKLDVEDAKDEYSQDVPEEVQNERRRGPPVLPPHLLQVILNKDTPVSCEPTLLPEPNHVMLNHMYALSIRDGMMVLSTSNRYKKKCVTTLIYRPI